VEDPALFLPLGINPVWLWIPRLLTAIVAVHLISLYKQLLSLKNVFLKFRTP